MGFIQIPDWAARGVLHPREFAVYAALLSRADAKTRECYPSYGTLAAESGVARRQVGFALAELIDEGLVTLRRGRSVNRYIVDRFADARPEGFRSRFERGDRLAVRDTVRETHSASCDDVDTVRETHSGNHDAVRETPSAECAISTPQSARDALEPYPVEPDPDEPPTAQRSAPRVGDIVEAEIVDDDAFDRVWAVWPKKTSKKTARLKFAAAAQRHPRSEQGLVDDIVEHARAYVQHQHPVQYVPMLSTWLNGDRWDDPLPSPRRGGTVHDHNAAILARYLGPEGEQS